MAGKLFRKADKEAYTMLAEALRHPDHEWLSVAGVKWGLVMVDPAKDANGEPTGPALVSAQHAVLGMVKLIPQRDRVFMAIDVMILVDAPAWRNMNSQRVKLALLDHQVSHCAVRLQGPGRLPVTHADGRVRVWMLPHDFQVGGFAGSVKRYGRDALLYLSLRETHSKLAGQATDQLMFRWASPAEGGPERRGEDLDDQTVDQVAEAALRKLDPEQRRKKPRKKR